MNCPRRRGRSVMGLGAAWVVILAAAGGASARGPKYGDLLNRVPEQANVLLFVDVAGLYASPLAQDEHWGEKAAAGDAGLGLPTDLARTVVAANYDLASLHQTWRAALGDFQGDLPDLERIARREGGYTDTIQNTSVALIPRGMALVVLAPRILALLETTDRQALGHWLQGTLTKPRTYVPRFADTALFRAEHGSQIVLAVNLADAIAVKPTEAWLHGIEAVKRARLAPSLLAPRLAGIESASLQVDATSTLTGTIRLQFREPVDFATPALKEIVLTVIEDCGGSLPELESWTIRLGPDKTSVELSGRLGTESVRRILSLAQPHNASPARKSYADAEPTGEDRKPAEPTADDVAAASRRYYHAVVDLLDGLRGVDRPTYRSQKLWYERYAKQIEELPILGVDSELLDWGSTVSRTLREMSYGINYADKDASYRLSQSANGAYMGWGGYYYGSSKGYDADVLKKQTNAVVSVKLDGTWQTMEASVADMRRKMTEKYKVEF